MDDVRFRGARAITPHDTNASIVGSPTAIYVGVAGNIALRLVGDSADVTFVGAAAGSILPLEASHIRSTSTTATNLVALYE
jgi:hypothetical protein